MEIFNFYKCRKLKTLLVGIKFHYREDSILLLTPLILIQFFSENEKLSHLFFFGLCLAAERRLVQNDRRRSCPFDAILAL